MHCWRRVASPPLRPLRPGKPHVLTSDEALCATAVPAANRDYIRVVSDDRGRPPLKADHIAPVAFAEAYSQPGQPNLGPLIGGSKTVNSLGYYGFWKLFDALTDAAFFGKNRSYALGNTPEHRFMGRWSDGTPVKEAVVL